MKKILKRLLPLFMAALLVCLSLPITASAAGQAFSDVPKDSAYAGYIYAMVEKGIVNGMTKTTFVPGGQVTRAQFLKMLAVAVHTEDELKQYAGTDMFSDVKPNSWFRSYVNWGVAMGITNGTNGKFNPDDPVSRQEIAVFAMRFAEKYPEYALTEKVKPVTFSDQSSIGGWALDAVQKCQRAGVMEAVNGAFQPRVKADRGMTVKILCNLLGIAPLDQSQIPDPPKPVGKPYKEPTTFSKTVAGIGVSGVEIDPAAGFITKVGLASDKLDKAEGANAIVTRNKGYVAVDGIFFDSYSGSNDIFGTMISQGEIIRILNANAPKKPTFVVDSAGNASIQFMTVNQTLSLTVSDEKGEKTYSIKNVGTNYKLADNDGSRMIYTRRFGDKVPGKVEKGLEVDANGVITKKYANATNVAIPKNGYVVVQRMARTWNDDVFTKSKVGDKLVRTIEYEGSTVQDVYTALSCGPTLVKDGKAYGSKTTYAEEGFTDPHVISEYGTRMAIGVKKDGTVVIASAGGYLSDMSKVMAGMGCQTAMNLDGGASTALYAKGSWRIPAGRNLSNMLIFSKK